jgi:hypothetical protein
MIGGMRWKKKKYNFNNQRINIIMNTIHLPILTLLKKVEEMKQHHSYLKNDHINSDLDYIIKELRTIKNEEKENNNE